MKWIFSKFELVSNIITSWDKTIESDEEQKKNIEEHLNNLRSPFGFLKNIGTDPT
jgi:hypothetical protein